MFHYSLDYRNIYVSFLLNYLINKVILFDSPQTMGGVE